MAQLQQRVFMIFIRTYQKNSKNLVEKVDFANMSWRDLTTQSSTNNTPLSKLSAITDTIGTALNVPSTAPGTSDDLVPFNSNSKFNNDIWWLHSIWTSFDEMKKNARPIVNAIGLNNVLVGGYINLSLELLPNK